MKNLKILLAFLFVLTGSLSAFAQIKYKGTVVGIVNGKTVVIQLATRNKLTAELQYIEVPEPEQELHQTVKEHLQKLLLGKEVEFFANQMEDTKTIGQIFSGGIDMSQQMLRDGAAWFPASDKTKQPSNSVENQNYRAVEAQARLEKRGVWSIPNLKPAWEFRAEKEKINKPQETVVEETGQTTAPVPAAASPAATADSSSRNLRRPAAAPTVNVEMWADVKDYSSIKEAVYSTGLVTSYIPFNDLGYISTPDLNFGLPAADNVYKATYRIGYFYKGERPSLGQDSFLIWVHSQSRSWAFSQSNSLSLIADRRVIDLGKARRIFRQGNSHVEEFLLYRVSRANLAKIAGSRNIELKVGKYSNPVSSSNQTSIRTLLSETVE